MAHNRQHNTGRFMSEDMWNEKYPDRPYMTDEAGDDIDSRSDTGAYVSPAQRLVADAEFARQDADRVAMLGQKGGVGLGGGYGKKRVGEQSRKQMNLTGNSGRSILTS
jgi:hypothetical protein